MTKSLKQLTNCDLKQAKLGIEKLDSAFIWHHFRIRVYVSCIRTQAASFFTVYIFYDVLLMLVSVFMHDELDITSIRSMNWNNLLIYSAISQRVTFFFFKVLECPWKTPFSKLFLRSGLVLQCPHVYVNIGASRNYKNSIQNHFGLEFDLEI